MPVVLTPAPCIEIPVEGIGIGICLWEWQGIQNFRPCCDIYVTNSSKLCKMQYKHNLVLEILKYFWFFLAFWVVIFNGGLKLAIFLNLWWTLFFLWCNWCPVLIFWFHLLLGFKARVGNFIHTWWRKYICDTCQLFDSHHIHWSDLLHIPITIGGTQRGDHR